MVLSAFVVHEETSLSIFNLFENQRKVLTGLQAAMFIIMLVVTERPLSFHFLIVFQLHVNKDSQISEWMDTKRYKKKNRGTSVLNMTKQNKHIMHQ